MATLMTKIVMRINDYDKEEDDSVFAGFDKGFVGLISALSSSSPLMSPS